MPAIVVQITYFIGVVLLIFGFKKMNSPSSPKQGITWSGIGLLITFVITYFNYKVTGNYLLMTLAILLGGGLAFLGTKNTKLTDTPKMLALFNAMSSGAVATIASLSLINIVQNTDVTKFIVMLSALLGSISFSASLIIFFRLNGTLKNSNRFPMQQWLNALILVVAITFGIAIVLNGNQFEITSLLIFLVLALLFGILFSLPIVDEGMPIAVPLFIVFTGFAIGFLGYVMSNPAMIIGGVLAGSTTLVLTRKISKTMNRSIATTLFGNEDDDTNEVNNINNTIIKVLETDDAATMMAFAKNVIIIPGFGIASAQAIAELWEISNQLKDNSVNVKFAVHPVAGRMPGHIDLILAEAGIPYDSIYDLHEINDNFEKTDIVLMLGANDITNPSARSDQSSPIYGMPILNADKAKNVIIVKRGNGTGYSNIDNPLFYNENTGFIYGDAKTVLNNLIRKLKAI